MNTIIVDDEPIMLRSFARLSEGIAELENAVSFTDPKAAEEYASLHSVDLAILDIAMPEMNGMELAERLRAQRPDIIIVFITAYDEYIRAANTIGADDYIVKPYKKETLERMAEKVRLLSARLKKPVQIRCFGNFTVIYNGQPVPLRGKAKEILARIVAERGGEVSNETLYSTLWEDRPYSNIEMKVYYNALRRLKDTLAEAGLEKLLISTTRGQMLNTDMADCDYYDFLAGTLKLRRVEAESFMREYSWGEYILANFISSTN